MFLKNSRREYTNEGWKPYLTSIQALTIKEIFTASADVNLGMIRGSLLQEHCLGARLFFYARS